MFKNKINLNKLTIRELVFIKYFIWKILTKHLKNNFLIYLNLIEDDVYIGSNSIKNIDRLSFKKIILKNLKKSYITPEDSIKSLLILFIF
jgi:hypothetical protein